MRARIAAGCRRIVESSWFDPLMLSVIAVNAVTLGLQTYDSIEASIGHELHVANEVILGLFVVELLLRMAAHADRPLDFFRSGWNVFDFVVIGASFVPGVRENATLLRLVRLLRIVRAVRLLPDLRVLVSYVLLASFLIFNLFIGIVINSMEEARAIELHRAERELLEDDDHDDHEQAHKVVLEERLRALRSAVEELEREVRAKS